MEKYKTIKMPKHKVNKNNESITHKLKYINRIRFIDTSLSNHVDNLSEINKCKCKDPEQQRMHTKLRNDVLICRCKTCHNKSYKSINDLKEKFPNSYRFCKGDNNKFILLLRKGIYPYNYMDS